MTAKRRAEMEDLRKKVALYNSGVHRAARGLETPT